MIFINEEDHLKIKLKATDKAKIADNLVTYFDLLEKFEEKFAFAWDNDIGYLNTVPINVGCATLFSCKMKVPKTEINKGNVLNEIIKKIEDGEKDLNITLDKIEKGEFDVLTISNKSPFYSFANFLIDLMKIKDHLR